MVEMNLTCQSDNGSLTEQHALSQWSSKYMQSLDGIKDPRIGSRLSGLMTTAGLVEVDQKVVVLPLSGWSNGT